MPHDQLDKRLIINLDLRSKKPQRKGWNAGLAVGGGGGNYGLLLGDVVDVEGDDGHANSTLDRLIGGAPHPSYKSSRSVHHLFLTPDPALTRLIVGKIEFRGKGHFSVIPPSIHPDGTEYEWLPESKFPIPQMPPSLIKFYFKAKAKKEGRDFIKPGFLKCFCGECRDAKFRHKNRFREELIEFRSKGLPWLCNKCR